MIGQTVHITRNEGSQRIEARFGFDAAINPELKRRAGARWDPTTRCWWADLYRHQDIVNVFTDAGYEILGDLPKQPKPKPAEPTSLATAVDTVIRAVSPERQNRLVRSIAVAAHPDGDGPNRPAAADELILLATDKLNS